MHEHGNGHWADAPRVGGNLAGQRLDAREIHIAYQAGAALGCRVGHSVDADIHDHGARFDHGRFDELRHTHGGDEDVSAPAVGADVAGCAMAKGHGGVGVPLFLAEHRRQRLADDVAASEYHDLGPAGLDVRAGKQLADARRGAGEKTARVPQHQFADIDRVKSIHVFVREHGRIDHSRANVAGQRGLDKDSVQARRRHSGGPAIRAVRASAAVCGSTCVSEEMPNSRAGLFLAPDIDLRGGVFAHAHKGQPGPHAAVL